MIDLELSKDLQHPYMKDRLTGVKRSRPFADSLGSTYVHRVRHVLLHNSLGEGHLSVSCWCGYSIIIARRRKGRLIETPTEGKPMCATCEGKAVGAGMDGERVINGREVMYQPRGHKP